MNRVLAVLTVLACAFAPTAFAQEQVLNLYSARHYQTDEALYQNFTKQTGIRINRIEAGDDQLIERLKSEGANTQARTVTTARTRFMTARDRSSDCSRPRL